MKRRFSLFPLFLLVFLMVSFGPMAEAQSIKPGTEIRVQLLDQLDTGNAQVGQKFTATLAEPITMESGAVWPKGTEVKGEIIEVVSSGRLSRPASITLRLTQIGNAPLNTEIEKIDGKSHGGRNAALIGGMGAFGALLGGLAGGGKGAAIGATAGAGAGVATAAATGKREIVLRPETPLTFAVASNVATEPQVSSPAPEPVQPVQPAQPQLAQAQDYQDSSDYQPFAPEQLDNLLSPVALYPDPLLAQVLLAATFPDQIQDADQWLPVNDPRDIEYQPWDVSVKAVAHYPSVLSMLDRQPDWTTALGQAYVYQSTDVMAAVQRLRNLAYLQGNLRSTPEQQVISDDGYIQIVPAQPRLIYVPTYDPTVVYVRPVYRPGYGFDGFYSFGTGYAIGAWLNHDMDWNSRRVVYDGWDARPGGWRERSRPYVQVTNVYVDQRYEQVNVNRNVLVRRVNYENVDRRESVHPGVNFDNRARIESDRARNEASRAGQPQPNFRDGRAGEPGNGNRNQFGVRNQPEPDRQPEQPRKPQDVRFERDNQAPSNVEPSRPQPSPQPSDDRVNERGNGRGNQFGVRNQPESPRQPEQPQRPQGAGFERGNPATPSPEPSRPQPSVQPSPQPSNGGVNERGNGRGNQFGVRNQPESARQPEQPQRPQGVGFERGNQAPPNPEPSRPQPSAQPSPQPSNGGVNERGNGRGNQFGVRSQPAAMPERPLQPQAPAAQQPPAQMRPAASPVPAAAQPSPVNHAGSQPQPQQNAHPGNSNKGKENDKGNGRDKK